MGITSATVIFVFNTLSILIAAATLFAAIGVVATAKSAVVKISKRGGGNICLD